MAIKCFVSECAEDVTGQCPGLAEEPCGHFYCGSHSRGKLCDECAAVQEQQNLFQEYCTVAEDVYKVSPGLNILWGIMFGTFPLCIIGIVVESLWFFILIGVGSFALSIVIFLYIERQRKKRLLRACEKYENFEEFYGEYKKQANKAAMFSMIAKTMDFTSDMLSSDPVQASDVRRIRQRLERMD
jgi:hypothetical protein